MWRHQLRLESSGLGEKEERSFSIDKETRSQIMELLSSKTLDFASIKVVREWEDKRVICEFIANGMYEYLYPHLIMLDDSG